VERFIDIGKYADDESERVAEMMGERSKEYNRVILQLNHIRAPQRPWQCSEK